MDQYVKSGYWATGYAVGDAVVRLIVDSDSCTGYVGEMIAFCPLQAFSDSGKITYSVYPPLSNGLSIDPETCVIQGMPITPSASKEYKVAVLVDSSPISYSDLLITIQKSEKIFDLINIRSVAQSRVALQFRGR